MLWPRALQFGARRADVARKGVSLAHNRVDDNRHALHARQRSSGLECAGVRRRYDPSDWVPRERPCRIDRLGMTEFGQPRVDNARIPPRGREAQIELALPMAQKDHAACI